MLSLNNAKITDKGLVSLGRIRTLKNLYLYDNKITDKAVTQLKRSLPGCEIHYKRVAPPPAGPAGPAVAGLRVPSFGGPMSPKN